MFECCLRICTEDGIPIFYLFRGDASGRRAVSACYGSSINAILEKRASDRSPHPRPFPRHLPRHIQLSLSSNVLCRSLLDRTYSYPSLGLLVYSKTIV